jgi:hypothetical protein
MKPRRIGVSSDSRICAILAEFDGTDAAVGGDSKCYDRAVSISFSRQQRLKISPTTSNAIGHTMLASGPTMPPVNQRGPLKVELKTGW